MIQFLGMLALMGTVAVTVVTGIFWLRGRRRILGRIALTVPATYLLLLVLVTAFRARETLPVGTPLRFCGFYLDCHLSATVVRVVRTPSAWTVTLRIGNDARRVALTPFGLRVELMRGDSTVLLPLSDPTIGDQKIEAGGGREVTVAFAAPTNDEMPALRVTQGIGIDHVIEGALLGDDDALGRVRVKLGL
jgi:hypothetical protein